MTAVDRATYYRVVPALDAFLEVAARTQRERATGKLRAQLAARLSEAFLAQGKAFLAKFAKLHESRLDYADGRWDIREAAEPDWEPLFDAAATGSITAFESALSEFVQLALEAGATELLGQLGLDTAFDLASPAAVAYIEQHAAELVAQVNEVTKITLRNIIANGVEAGESYASIAKSIQQTFSDMSRDRALLIATTEMGNAYEAGTALTAQQLADAGLDIEKSWLTAGDDRVDEDCQANENAGWIPLEDAFPSGDDQPLSHPNCRCTALYRRKPGEGE